MIPQNVDVLKQKRVDILNAKETREAIIDKGNVWAMIECLKKMTIKKLGGQLGKPEYDWVVDIWELVLIFFFLMSNLLTLLLILYFLVTWHVELPWPGIEPMHPALEAWNLSHWTIRAVPVLIFLDVILAWWLCRGLFLFLAQVECKSVSKNNGQCLGTVKTGEGACQNFESGV